MKLLLTSNGLSNPSIAKALFDLVGKPPSETSITFIPTAMNPTLGEKDWFINDLVNIKNQQSKFIDIVDIAALPKKVWQPRIERADVLFFSGGNSFYLMHWLRESGLYQMLPTLLKTRIYAGISAGSMVTNPSLELSGQDKKLYFEEVFGYADEKALHLVDFYTRPHYNSPDFPNVRKSNLEEIAQGIKYSIYGLDDNSAVKVDGKAIEVISEGQWDKFN